MSPSLEEAMAAIQTEPLSQTIESVFILGGHNVYKTAMESLFCEKLYITEVHGDFPCDTVYPLIDPNIYCPVKYVS